MHKSVNLTNDWLSERAPSFVFFHNTYVLVSGTLLQHPPTFAWSVVCVCKKSGSMHSMHYLLDE
jgi:hypothetical protein